MSINAITIKELTNNLDCFANWKLFFKFIIRKRPIVIVSGIFSIIHGCLDNLRPFLIGYFSDKFFEVITGKSPDTVVIKAFFIFLAFLIIQTIVVQINQFLVVKSRCSIQSLIGIHIFEYINQQDLDYYNSLNGGHFNIMVSDLIKKTTDFFDDVVNCILAESIAFVITLFYLMVIGVWYVKLGVVIMCILQIIVSFFFTPKIKNYSNSILLSINNIILSIKNYFTFLELINSFYNKIYERQRFHKNINDLKSSSGLLGKNLLMYRTLLSFIFIVVQQTILFKTLLDILKRVLSPGSLILYASVFHRIYDNQSNVLRKIDVIDSFNSIKNSLTNIFRTSINQSLEFDSDINQKSVTSINKFDISFKNFKIKTNKHILLTIDRFTIREGEKYVIMGRSGCGKSTLSRILMRLYNNYDGEVCVGGSDINLYNREAYRSCITLISQSNELLEDSIYNNIRYSDLSSSMADVKHGAERTYINRVIESFPLKYDTVIGRDNMLLSGGQRQRLCLSRLFLSKAKILILDEVTSAMDMGLEDNIYKNILDFVINKTLIVIAHRISVLKYINNVIYIDNGKIFAVGRHEDLLRLNSKYRQFILNYNN